MINFFKQYYIVIENPNFKFGNSKLGEKVNILTTYLKKVIDYAINHFPSIKLTRLAPYMINGFQFDF